MTDDKLFSVIVLSYENGRYFADSIGSVLKQEYPEIELIVADDGSTVFDKAWLEQFIAENRQENLRAYIVYQNPQNMGTVRSINTALAKAHGTYIKLLAADDALYDPSSLSQAAHALQKSADGIIVCHVMGCTPALEDDGLFRDKYVRKLSQLDAWSQYRALCTRNRIAAVGVFFRKDFFDSNGFFDEQYRLLEDWPTWLRITRNGKRFEAGDFLGVRYRKNIGSSTGIVVDYLMDKERAFEREIKPYRKEIGLFIYLRAYFVLRMRNMRSIRKVFGWLFRRKEH